MLRRLRYSPPHVFRTLRSRQRPILGLAIAAIGTFFYAQRAIRADSSEDDPNLVIYTLLSQPGPIISRPITISLPSNPDPEQEKLHEQLKVKLGLGALSGYGTIDGTTGISRFDSTSVPSSASRLDKTLLSSNIMSTNTCWTMFTMHEGFLSSGWLNMEVLSECLHRAVLASLIGIFSKYEHSPEHSDVASMMTYAEEVEEDGFENAVCQTLKRTFLDIDDIMVHRPVELLASPEPPSMQFITTAIDIATTGSSALVAFYDHEPRKLRVANTGSTRAVLGRKSGLMNGHQMYTVHVLSEDHTIDTAPGLSRAFGLGPLKWSLDVQKRLQSDAMGDRPLIPPLDTPITAEPSVTTIDVRPGDFLIMGTSGLWNSLTNEEAVGLVGLWLNRNMVSASVHVPSSQYQDVVLPSDLPAPVGTDNTTMYQRWGVKKRFICVDNNAAQHLSRNALGGADVSWTTTLLAHTPPQSLELRDDVTVTVVFFDDKS